MRDQRQLNGQKADQMMWFEQAACRGRTELFYGEEVGRSAPARRRQREAVAKSICATCPVIDQCLAAAFEHEDEHGIWGGLTPKERHVVRFGSEPPRRRRPGAAA